MNECPDPYAEASIQRSEVSDYTSEAQKTNAPITPELLARLISNKALSALVSDGLLLVEATTNLELLKKHIFYGKDVSFESPVGILDSDRVRRILVNEKMVKLVHGIIGKCTEAGELMQQLLDHLFNGMDLDEINLVEELGDDFWYNCEILTALGITREEVERRNIAKLKARYPGKFTEEAALNRDLVNERKTLET